MQLNLQHVMVFRFAQETAYTVPCHTLSFVFSGLEYCKTPGCQQPAGTTGISLYPQDMPIHLSFNAERENYAILFDSNDVRASDIPGSVEIRHDDAWTTLPGHIPVDASSRLEEWRRELQRIRTAHLMPTPTNRLRAELGVLNLIRTMMDGTPATVGVTPAEQLKILIEADVSETRSTDALCAECGYSPDYMRILFAAAYGSTPKKYRMRRRMAAAMEWITGSDATAKEITWRLGFSQASHFSAAFKRIHDLSPREAIQRFRGTSRRYEASPPLTPKAPTTTHGVDFAV